MAATVQASALAARILDTKLLKGPPTWQGDKKTWRHFASKLEGFVSGVSPMLLELMQLAADYKEPIDHAEMAPEHKEASSVLFAILNS